MKGKYKIITPMLIFGSIGVFVKGIDRSSSEIAFLRGMIGCLSNHIRRAYPGF
ncbi:hypothetical protein [Bacillus sp. EB600]|uniref:hypothetical protein n=1 Tax=Bacillus sp. EB600 TaxID=2806345 RepID=UPI00210BACC3|nr:hypothetical protein [Bacillus sp. EB600]